MKSLTLFAALAACAAVAGAALAEDRSAAPGPIAVYIHASQEMVRSPHGRFAVLSAMPVSAPSPAQSVMDCSTDARQEGELTLPYACVALPEWPTSGTPFSIEDETRRRFEGQ